MSERIELKKLTRYEKKRFIILTDMENEPDDSQTMVKLLLYSNEIDIEGLIAVTSCWLQDDNYPESIVSRVQAYGIVRENLKLHAEGWPTQQELLAKVVAGQKGFGMSDVGDGKSSDGSNLIMQVLKKNDERPVYFSINAGGNTLAQALWDLRKTCDEKTLKECLSKVRVFDDSGQDDSGAWMNQEFPDMFFVRNSPQVYGLFGPDLNTGPQPWKPLNQFEWAEENIRKCHGILGELFPQRVIHPHFASFPDNVPPLFFWFMDGGGTTGVLQVLNTGMNDPEQITWGGWGGRFSNIKQKVWAGESSQNPYINEHVYEWNSMYPSAPDSWYDKKDKVFYENNIFAPLWRFRADILFDFQARMDWCVADYKNANHHPIARVNGDDGERCILTGNAKAGQVIEFDATGSSDPDSDNLSFNWWVYNEAGTYGKDVRIENADRAIVKVQIPEDAKTGETIHLVLEVFDDCKIVSLKAYRRIVIEIKQ